MLKKDYSILFFILLIMPLINSNLGISDPNLPKLEAPPIPVIAFDNDTIAVNFSKTADFWDLLDTPADISAGDLGDGDFGSANVNTTGTMTAEHFKSTDDIEISDLLSAARGDFISTSASIDILNLKGKSELIVIGFVGTGLNDLTLGGTYTGRSTLEYRVEIDGTGSPDTFKWSNDAGSTFEATGVSITGSAQTLENGITVTFGAPSGHTSGDYWRVGASAYTGTPFDIQNPAGTTQFKVNGFGELTITGSDMTDDATIKHITGTYTYTGDVTSLQSSQATFFDTTLTVQGGTVASDGGLVATTYDIGVTGNMGTTGATSKRGINIDVDGTADINRGVQITASGGTINEALVIDGGILWLIDNIKNVLGTGKDSSIYYNTSDLIIDPDEVGGGKVFIGASGDDDLGLKNLDAWGNITINIPSGDPTYSWKIGGVEKAKVWIDDSELDRLNFDVGGETRMTMLATGPVSINSALSRGNLFVKAQTNQDGFLAIHSDGSDQSSMMILEEVNNFGMYFEYDGGANIGHIGMSDNIAPAGAWSKRISMSRSGTEVNFTAGNVGITNGDLNVAGNITANYFIGNGSLLTDLTESQITDLQTYTINNTAGWILNFTKIFSDDWTNVTITESQISDLVHTINETNINVLNINASHTTITGDLNITGNTTLENDLLMSVDNRRIYRGTGTDVYDTYDGSDWIFDISGATADVGNADVIFKLNENAGASSFFIFDGDNEPLFNLNSDGGLTIVGDMAIGIGEAGIDHFLKFDGETSDGIITWLEDENTFDLNNHTQIDGDLNITGNFTGNNYHGSIYNHEDNMTTIVFASQDVYVNVTNMTLSDSGVNGFLPSITNGGEGLIALVGGKYSFDWSLSFNGQTGSTHGGSVAVEGVKNEECYARRKLGSLDTGNMGGGCHIDVLAGDVINLVIADEDVGLNNVNVIAGNLRLTRIAG